MKSQLLAISILGLLATAAGCAMCAGPHDHTYSAYGGRWQRADPCCGRVGSVFHPAEMEVVEIAEEEAGEEIAAEGGTVLVPSDDAPSSQQE